MAISQGLSKFADLAGISLRYQPNSTPNLAKLTAIWVYNLLIQD